MLCWRSLLFHLLINQDKFIHKIHETHRERCRHVCRRSKTVLPLNAVKNYSFRPIELTGNLFRSIVNIIVIVFILNVQRSLQSKHFEYWCECWSFRECYGTSSWKDEHIFCSHIVRQIKISDSIRSSNTQKIEQNVSMRGAIALWSS